MTKTPLRSIDVDAVIFSDNEPDPQLVEKSRQHTMTPEERQQQRRSLVIGLRGHTMTRDELEAQLKRDGP